MEESIPVENLVRANPEGGLFINLHQLSKIQNFVQMEPSRYIDKLKPKLEDQEQFKLPKLSPDQNYFRKKL